MQDTDIESAEAAALAAQAADLLTSAHAAAVEEANNQFSDDQDQGLGQHLFIAPLPVGRRQLKTRLHIHMLLSCVAAADPPAPLPPLPSPFPQLREACMCHVGHIFVF